MGNRDSVCQVHQDAPSPTYYELKSVVSDPLQNIIDYDSFFDRLVALIKDGGLSRNDPNLKDATLFEERSDGFSFFKTWDGKSWNLDHDYVMEQSYQVFKDRGLIWEELRLPPERWLREVGVLIVHRPTLRVECWRQTMAMQRSTGVEATLRLYSVLADALNTPAVHCKPDQDSILVKGGLNVMTEDLTDKGQTFDELWRSIIETFKSQRNNTLKRWAEVRDYKKDQKTGNEEFLVLCLMDGQELMRMGMMVPGGMDRLFTYKCLADKERRIFAAELIDPALFTVWQIDYLVVHKEPHLCVESWITKFGARRSGPHLRSICEWVINTVVKGFREDAKKPKLSANAEAQASSSSGAAGGEASPGSSQPASPTADGSS